MALVNYKHKDEPTALGVQAELKPNGAQMYVKELDGNGKYSVDKDWFLANYVLPSKGKP